MSELLSGYPLCNPWVEATVHVGNNNNSRARIIIDLEKYDTKFDKIQQNMFPGLH